MESEFEDAFERHIEPDLEQQTAEADSWSVDDAWYARTAVWMTRAYEEWLENARNGDSVITADGVRRVFQMEPEEAIQHGVVTPILESDGQTNYRSIAAFTRTVDIDGARFTTTRNMATTIEEGYREGYRATLTTGDPEWSQSFAQEVAEKVNEAIGRGDMLYQEPSPDQLVRVDGIEVTMLSEEARHHERMAAEQAAARDLSGQTVMTGESVRDLLGMEPRAAVARGIVVTEQVNGTLGYRGTVAPTAAERIAARYIERKEMEANPRIPGHAKEDAAENLALEVKYAQESGQTFAGAAAPREAQSATSRVAAKALAAKLLGGGVRLFDADTLNGKYAGPVIGVTDLHVIQQVTAQAAVLHRVDAERTGILGDLLADPKQPVAINYSQHTATVKELQRPGVQRDSARER